MLIVTDGPVTGSARRSRPTPLAMPLVVLVVQVVLDGLMIGRSWALLGLGRGSEIVKARGARND